MAELDEPLRDVRERIDRASRVCVLSGAGMSAESGIATFRDALTGLWLSLIHISEPTRPY